VNGWRKACRFCGRILKANSSHSSRSIQSQLGSLPHRRIVSLHSSLHRFMWANNLIPNSAQTNGFVLGVNKLLDGREVRFLRCPQPDRVLLLG